MNLVNKMIIEEYRMQRNYFIKLKEIVDEKLNALARESHIETMPITSRVKEEKSLAGKLERADRYQSLDELTDIYGARVICFFQDDVEKLCKMIEETFAIDWENSVDKSKLLDIKQFGYLSVHYICSLKAEDGYPEELCSKRFEIQLRTNLQHTWAQIEHDLGYKNEFGVPRAVVRNFARISGMLELIDAEFVRTRDLMKEYTESVRQKIIDNCADDVHIDSVSLSEYIKRNKFMREFLERLADINGSEIDEVNPTPYIEQLEWFGITKLGGLQDMMKEYGELAFELAKKTLENTDLDILSSNVGLRYLCRAKLLKEYSEEKAVEFLHISICNMERAKKQASSLYRKKV